MKSFKELISYFKWLFYHVIWCCEEAYKFQCEMRLNYPEYMVTYIDIDDGVVYGKNPDYGLSLW